MIRDFIPGACTVGPTKEIFTEIDKGSHDEGLIALAQEACRNCLQLPHCEEQRTEIAKELGARGVGKTVIGALVIETPPPSENNDAMPQDTSFTFNLQYPLEEPRHILEIIRQGFRSGQLSLRGRQSGNYASLMTKLHDQLVEDEGEELQSKDINPTIISKFVSTAMLRYVIAKRPGDSTFKRNAHLSEEELAIAKDIQRIATADAITLKEMSAHNPEVIAQYHQPELFKAVMRKYEKGFGLTTGEIRRVFYESPFDPLSAVEQLIAKRQELEAGRKPAATIAVPRQISEKAHATTKLAALRYKNKRLTKITSLPHMRQFANTIIKNNAKDPVREICALHEHVKDLRKKHNDIDAKVIAYLAYHHKEHADEKIEIFRQVFDEISNIYAKNHDLTIKLLQRFAYEHLSDAEAMVQKYLDRLKRVRSLSAEENFQITNNFARQYALELFRPLTSDEIATANKKFKLSLAHDRRFKKTEGWIREKIIEFYSEDESKEVAINVATFLRRDYLRIAYATTDTIEATPATPYNIYDPKKGAYLTWSGNLIYLTTEERAAILSVFGLDKLVLGNTISQDTLKEHFQVTNLERYVDEHLLPYTLHMPRYSRNPLAILDYIRRGVRDDLQSSKQIEQDRVKVLLTDLVTWLKAELPAYYDNPQNKELKRGLKILISRVLAYAPGALRKPGALNEVALAYLREVVVINNLAIPLPYRVALAYGSDYCQRLVQITQREMPAAAPTFIKMLITRTVTSQAMPLFRRFQHLVKEKAPEFQKRKIRDSICYRICCANVTNAQNINNILQTYDTVREKYAKEMIGQNTLDYFCLNRTTDPIDEIESWKTAMNDLDEYYKQRIDKPYLRRILYTKRNGELKAILDERLKKVDDHLAYNRQKPHPAIDEELLILAYFSQGSSAQPDKWLGDYKARWEEVHKKVDTSDLKPRMVRQIIATRKNEPIRALERYRELCDNSANDYYIEQWMVDEACQWNTAKAYLSLARLRLLLRSRTIRLDKVQEFEDRSTRRQLAEEAALSVHELAFGEDEEDKKHKEEAAGQKKAIISSLLETAAPMQKAAIAIAYDIPWLMPVDMRSDEENGDKVYAYYQVNSLSELITIADSVLHQIME